LSRRDIPPFDVNKVYDRVGKYADRGEVYGHAAAWLDTLPPLPRHLAAEVAAKLLALEEAAGDRTDVRRAFADYAEKRGWLTGGLTVPQIFQTAEPLARDNEREFELLVNLGKAGLDDGFVGGPIVDGVLYRNMPGVLAGPLKAYKTGLAVALGVCVSNGVPFLGRAVPEAARVGGLFGESAGEALRAAARRVADAIGGTLDNLDLFTVVRSLGGKQARDDLGFLARRGDWRVCIIDPLYKALGGRVDVGSLYSTAARLRAVVDELSEYGCTPLFVHHSTRALEVGRPMGLGDLLGAGTGEFFRSWALVNRAVPFDPGQPGRHGLIVTYGSCQGGAGRLRLDVNEGLGGTPWRIDVRPQGDPERPAGAERTSPAERVLDALATLSAKYKGRVPRTKLGAAAKVTGGNLTAVLTRLAGEGKVAVETEEYRYRGKPAKRQYVREAVPKGSS
jgi:hypothetical protein